MKREFVIPSSKHDLPITFDVNYLEGITGRPMILFCHGFKGFKDWGYFNMMSDFFISNGFNCVKINFSHNGTSPEYLLDFVDLESFGNNNFSKELCDISDVMTYLEGVDIDEISGIERIYIVGHSKGGATSIVKFLDDERFTAAATLASVIHIKDRYAVKEVEAWSKTGVMYVYNARTDQNMPLYYQLAEDVLTHQDQFNISERLKRNKRPLLLIHGSGDETVPDHEAKSQLGKPNVDVQILHKADHVFGGGHPYSEKTLPVDAEKACRLIVDFFHKQ